jgi:hypothetical protein
MNNQSRTFIRKTRLSAAIAKSRTADFELVDGQVKLSELPAITSINDNDLVPFTSYESGDPVSSDIPALDFKTYVLAPIIERVSLVVANEDARLALTTSEVGDDQLVVQDSDHTVWVAINPPSSSSVGWLQIGDNSGSFDPFDAKVTTAAEWNTAIINAKKVIFVAAAFTFTQDVTLSVDTYVYVSEGLQINMGAYQLNQNNCVFHLEFCSNFSNPNMGWGYTPTVIGNSPFINSPLAESPLRDEHGKYVLNEDGTKKLSADPNQYIPLVFTNCRLGNSGSVANTPLSQTNKQIFNNVFVFSGNADNAGVNLSIQGSTFNNLTIISQGGSACTNCLVIADSCATGTGLSFLSTGANFSTNVITIGANNKIYDIQISASSGNAPIFSKGQIYGLSGVNSTVSVTLDGTNPILNGAIIAALIFETTAVNPSLNNVVATTFTPNNIKANINGCGGAIPNPYTVLTAADQTARLTLASSQVRNDQLLVQDSDKTLWVAGVSGSTVTWKFIGSSGAGDSPYAGVIDGVGTLPNHYINGGAAYAANKTYDFDTANITETANIVFNPADQLYIQVGQNFVHDLSTFQIIGSYNPTAEPPIAGGNALTINLADASATLQYSPAANILPIANFDSQSTVVIQGNDGTVINNAAGDNTYIQCDGTLLASNHQFNLPNASAGGYKTSLFSKLDGIEFVGGGANCEKAIICDGGVLSDIVFDGSYKENAVLLDIVAPSLDDEGNLLAVPAGTLYDNIFIDVNAPVKINIRGQASRISTNPNNELSFLTVAPESDTTMIACYSDAITLGPSITGCIFANGRAGLVSFAANNSTQASFVGYTFYNTITIYGNADFTGCHFYGGVTVAGGNVSFSNCDSTVALVVTAGNVRRSGNDTNIGNDLMSTVVVTGTTQQLAPNVQYIIANTALSTLQLPANGSSQVGDRIQVISTTVNGWHIAQAATQQILFGSRNTSSGVSGYLASSTQGDCLEMIKTGNGLWRVINAVGNLTLI